MFSANSWSLPLLQYLRVIESLFCLQDVVALGGAQVVLGEKSLCSIGQHMEGHLGWGPSLVTMATWFKASQLTSLPPSLLFEKWRR